VTLTIQDAFAIYDELERLRKIEDAAGRLLQAQADILRNIR